VLLEKLVIDPWLVVKTLQVGAGGKLEKILISLHIPGQQHHMIVAGSTFTSRLGESRLGGDIELRTDNRFDILFTTFEIELERPEHVSVIGQRQSGHPQVLGFGNEAIYGRSTVEKGEIGMVVKVYKI
jgi:hypothetical protein